MVQTDVPGAGPLRVSGIVDMVRARHEGSRFDSDVFLADEGLLAGADRPRRARRQHPVRARALRSAATGRRGRARRPVLRVTRRCISTRWRSAWSPALPEIELPIFVDLSFLDGRRGAHVNISGISGVATKTTYASFLLYALFHGQVLGNEAANTKALFFNVKGEDLLFLDKPNDRLSDQDRADYATLGLPAGPFESVGMWAPVKRGVGRSGAGYWGRVRRGLRSYFWTVRDVVKDRLLRFLFAEEGDERSQIADLVARVEHQLERDAEEISDFPASVRLPDPLGTSTVVHSFDELCELIAAHLEDEHSRWRGYIAPGDGQRVPAPAR